MIIETLSKIYSSYIVHNNNKWIKNGLKFQKSIFLKLVRQARNTVFGITHDFKNIRNYTDFKNRVPIRDYEKLRSYIENIIDGKSNVLWKGRPLYFAKTSGTTSGEKYIPITKDSSSNLLNGTKYTVFSYIHSQKNYDLLTRKVLYLSGSPLLDKKGGILTGRLSGIVNHHVPFYAKRNYLPSYEINCIEDWEKKLDRIIDESFNHNIGVIAGIPPWGSNVL